MFESLKDKLSIKKDEALKAANRTLYQPAVDAFAPKVAPLFKKVCDLAPGAVEDDAKYKSYVVDPAWLAVGAISGGIANAIPDLQLRFETAMFQARAELVAIDANTGRVALVDDAMRRLPQVLLEGISRPIPKGDERPNEGTAGAPI